MSRTRNARALSKNIVGRAWWLPCLVVSTAMGQPPVSYSPSQGSPFAAGTEPISVAVADLNGDSFPDLVTANALSDDVSVLLGNGFGGFAAATAHAVGDRPFSVAVADLNADGFPDVVTANALSDDVSVLLGNGRGGFAPARAFAAGNGPASVAVADLDANGALDLVTANLTSDDVAILLGDGTGGFAAPSFLVTGDGPRSVAVADLDANGHLDLVTANLFSNDVSIWLGLGFGAFMALPTVAVGNSPTSVAVERFDTDPFPDLVTTNALSDDISILRGDGTGGFTPGGTVPVGDNPNSVAVADLNADTFADLAVANFDSDDISVLLGDGTGGFVLGATFPAGDAPAAIAIADINPRTEPDLITANNRSDDVTVLVGPTSPASPSNLGSLLIYPVHRSGPTFFTIVSVTNTDTDPQTPTTFGGSTVAHFQYFNVTPNEQNPFQPLACTDFDRREFLTPADTLSVLTTCHNAFGPGGQQGYLVVSAEDPGLFQTAWSHDFLIGSELVINASGTTYAVNAIPFAARQPKGFPTDDNGNGRLDLDGAEYAGVPDTLILDSFLGLPTSQLALVNLTGDARDLNTLLFSIWNDNEFPLSATLTFNCWFDQPLSAVTPAFGAAFLASLPNDPGELDLNCDGTGDIETGWAVLDSIDVSSSGGSFVADDGAVVGSLTAGLLSGGRLLWEDPTPQTNGSVFAP